MPPCLTRYTNLRHLSLSNISFAPLTDPSRGEPPYHGWNTFELSTELKKHLEVIEIKRAVFLEPRVVVDLLEMERVPERRGESMEEVLQRFRESVFARTIEGNLESSGSSDDEEEPVGCKVILEDVYLESVSPG